MDYTALYLADSSLIGSKTLDNFSDVIRSYRPKSENENAVVLRLALFGIKHAVLSHDI